MRTEHRKSKTEAMPNTESRMGWTEEDFVDASELEFWGFDNSELVLREDSAKPLDLLERTAKFGESIIAFAKRVPRSRENDPLVNQLVRAATSVGANYCEADDPLSRKDYMKSIGICRKESKETKFWLRMVPSSEPGLKKTARPIWQEAKELNLIFGSIYRKKQ